MPKSDEFPHVIFVQKKFFHVQTKHSGKGANASVTSGPLFPTTPFSFFPRRALFPSNPPKCYALKEQQYTGDQTFSSTKRKIQQICQGLSPKKQRLFGQYLSISHTGDSHSVATMDYLPRNFEQIKYGEMRAPVKHLLIAFSQILQSLETCHQKRFIHRDIKPENLMFRDNHNVSLIDFGFLKKVSDQHHYTSGTPEYLNPRSFGDEAQDSLVNQKIRLGIQRPCDDMYALGLTGLNCVVSLLSQKIPKNEANVLNKALEALDPPEIIPDNSASTFTEEELRQLGRKYPYRAIFYDGDQKENIPEIVCVLPPVEDVKRNLYKLFATATLGRTEEQRLKDFALLCIELQEKSDLDRDNARETYAKIKAILAPDPQYLYY